MSDMPRICVTCKRFYVTPGCSGYSEYTPGYSASVGCERGHWEYDPEETTTAEYRAMILIALTCDDYAAVDVDLEAAND